MDNNPFTLEQLKKIYSDKDFMVFISNYYSSYDIEKLLTNISLQGDELDDYWSVYLRILLANITIFEVIIDDILKRTSYTYKEVKKRYVGEIKGRLALNEYVKNKAFVKLPNEYPCIIKTKSFENDENAYMLYSILKIKRTINKIEKLLNEKYYIATKEYIMLKEKRNKLDAYLRSNVFEQLLRNTKINAETSFSPVKLSNLINKISKGKIKNGFSYGKLIDWMNIFEKLGITWIDEFNIETLVYNDDFCNKLFEIWNLYLIKKVIIEKKYILIDENKLRPGMDSYVFKMNKANSNIEIYYQKGRGLYWNNSVSQNWTYKKSGKHLTGIPDISIVKNQLSKSIYMIDLKNKVRNSTENSDEIYKLIGYFSNFKDFFISEYPNYRNKHAYLIFRNDETPFDESLVDNEGNQVTCISVGVGDELINKKQIELMVNDII